MKKSGFLFLSLFVLFFSACTTDVPNDPSATETSSDIVEDQTFDKTININFSGNTATITPNKDGIAVTQSGAVVVVTSTLKGVEYILSGTTDNGSLKIYSDYKFKLTLNNVTLNSTDGPAINIQSSKSAYIVLTDNTTNIVADSNTYPTDTLEDRKGTIFSEGQLIFSGSGSLNITAKYKHAICSDDYIHIRSGNITISETVSDGLHSPDYILIDGGNLSVTSSNDGIECTEGYIVINNGTINVHSVDKAIVASFDTTTVTESVIDPYITINGGALTLATTGTKAHGISNASNVTINNGDISIVTSGYKSDGIHTDGTVTVNGGTLQIDARDDCMNVTPVINAGHYTCL